MINADATFRIRGLFTNANIVKPLPMIPMHMISKVINAAAFMMVWFFSAHLAIHKIHLHRMFCFQKTRFTYSSNPIVSFVLYVVIKADHLIKYSKKRCTALISFKLEKKSDTPLFLNVLNDKWKYEYTVYYFFIPAVI